MRTNLKCPVIADCHLPGCFGCQYENRSEGPVDHPCSPDCGHPSHFLHHTQPADASPPRALSILEVAEMLIHGDRAKQHGPASETYAAAAREVERARDEAETSEAAEIEREARDENVRQIVTALATGNPLCSCRTPNGPPATCVGAYEDPRNLAFGCEECCSHGNEDGWCVPIVSAAAESRLSEVTALRARLDAAERERDDGLRRIEDLHGAVSKIRDLYEAESRAKRAAESAAGRATEALRGLVEAEERNARYSPCSADVSHALDEARAALAAAESRLSEVTRERDEARHDRDIVVGLHRDACERARAAESAAGRATEALRARLDAAHMTTLGKLKAWCERMIAVGSEDAAVWVRGVSWGGSALRAEAEDKEARAALAAAESRLEGGPEAIRAWWVILNAAWRLAARDASPAAEATEKP